MKKISKNQKETVEYLKKALHTIKSRFKDKSSLEDTARRVVGVWFEMSEGYNKICPMPKWFKTSSNKGFLIKGPIKTYLLCPHHLLPINIKVFVGLHLKGYTLGISKITRVVLWASKVFALQEDVTKEIADKLWDKDKLNGLIVGIIGDHFCEKVRGVKVASNTVSIEYKGDIDNKYILIFNKYFKESRKKNSDLLSEKEDIQ